MDSWEAINEFHNQCEGACGNTLEAFKLDQEATIPTRAHATDAGIDIHASESVLIPVQSTVVVKTGIAINIPSGFVGKVEDRSSMAVKGLRTGAGIIDAGYSGEIGIVMHNLTNDDIIEFDEKLGYFQMGYRILKGQKIAQLLIYKVETPQIVEVKELWNSERKDKGFGSSDEKKTPG